MANDPLAAVLHELSVARKVVAKSANRQIRNREDRDIISATAYAWFESHRKRIGTADAALLKPVNIVYRAILDATDKNTTKTAYLELMATAKAALIAIRGHLLTAGDPQTASEPAPDFSPLVRDQVMRGILDRRWSECQKCLSVGADLAAVVMMGGLLEALFVARANKMPTKTPLFKAKVTPINPKTGKPFDLRDWMLASYIDVAHELGWITRSGKDVAAVLRDYRNYIHPEKERSHGITLNPHDSGMLWDVTRNLAKQVLAS